MGEDRKWSENYQNDASDPKEKLQLFSLPDSFRSMVIWLADYGLPRRRIS
jgi:hypothetical protein